MHTLNPKVPKRVVRVQRPALGKGSWGRVYASTPRTVVKVQSGHAIDVDSMAAYLGENYIHSVLSSDPVCSQFVPKLHAIFTTQPQTSRADPVASWEASSPDNSSDDEASEVATSPPEEAVVATVRHNMVQRMQQFRQKILDTWTTMVNRHPTVRSTLCDDDDCNGIALFSRIQRLHATGQTFLQQLPDAENMSSAKGDQQILSYIAQIAHALHCMHDRFQFNHGDLITANTMYQKTSARSFRSCTGATFPLHGRRHKIIDFGFSSVTVAGHKTVAPACGLVLGAEHHDKPERDMMLLLMSIVREHWTKIGTDVLQYLCNVLTVTTGEEIDMFGLLTIQERACFWHMCRPSDRIRYPLPPPDRPLVVRAWSDVYRVLGHPAFRNDRALPRTILTDLAQCLTTRRRRLRATAATLDMQFDTTKLQARYNSIQPKTVHAYFSTAHHDASGG